MLCHNAECRILFINMLNVIMLRFVILNAIMLSVMAPLNSHIRVSQEPTMVDNVGPLSGLGVPRLHSKIICRKRNSLAYFDGTSVMKKQVFWD